MSLEWLSVTDHVYVAHLNTHAVNVGLVLGTQQALLVDAGSSTEQGAEILASAQALSPVPVTYVAITHDHFDHTDGLAGMTGVTSVGHENVDRVRLDEPFSIVKALDLGQQRVEFLHFGTAHTTSDIFIAVPGENVIFTGDLLEEGATPQIDLVGSLANWPMVLDGILGATNNDTRFIPGHGAVVDRDFAFMQRAELALIYGQAEDLIRQGISVENAVANHQWPFTGELGTQLIAKAYAEHGAKGLIPKPQLPITSL